MDYDTQRIIILLIALSAMAITWKLVLDYYKTRFSKIFAFIISLVASFFIFIISLQLFIIKDEAHIPQLKISFSAILSIFVMIVILYVLFKYILVKK